MTPWYEKSFIVSNTITTLIFVIFLLTFRIVVARFIRSSSQSWTSQQRLRGLGYLKTAFFVILMLGIIYIWGEQIQGFAVSVFAIALAIVISVKETFINLNGAFSRIQGHHYEIGDRIRINNIRGDVIDISLLTTTLMEIGHNAANHQVTGKRIVIPNGMILTEPVINESFLDNFDLIHVTIPLTKEDDWKSGREALIQIAKEECAPYIEQARIRVRSLERSRSIELPSVEPRVAIQLPDPKHVHLHLRVPCPAHSREKVEQVILSRYLEQLSPKQPLEPNS